MVVQPRKTAVFSFCLLIYLAGVGVFALFSGHQEKEKILTDIDQRLLLAAKGLKYMLAPDFHDRATASDSIPLTEILQNQSIISDFAAESGFTYLYTVIQHENAFFFAAPTVTEEEYKERQNWYFYAYTDIPAAFVNALHTMEPAYVDYDDQWGVFRSVALPQKTPGGRSYLACADMDVGFINMLVRGVYLRMFLHSGYFLLLTLPFALTYLHYNRRLTRTNKKLSRHQGQLEDLVASRTAELEKEKCRAEASDRLKSVFMANISHEIRTPLNSILGFAELIQGNTSLEDAIKNAGFITRSGDHLFQLVDQLLDHTRITSGQVKMVNKPFDLKEFLEIMVQSESVTARKKDLEFIFRKDDRLPRWVDGDPFRLRQILLNLINNAVKFTPRGRIIFDVRCERTEKETVWICFSLEDTGIGIPPDKLEAIFSPFVQADDGTERIFGGTGLGTTIARQLVTIMGGRIQVENNEIAGCRFWFSVPMKKARMPAEKDGQSDQILLKSLVSRQTPGSILVVDDYWSNLALSRRQLEYAGHGVVTVDSGVKAVACCEKQTFDLILMDINMAGMDGYKTTRVLMKNNEWVRRVPIIAMTASADHQTMEKCRKAGMVDLIAKPVKRFQLLKMVGKWLQNPSMHPVSPPEQAFGADEALPAISCNSHHAESPAICREQALEEFDGDDALLDTVIEQFIAHLELQIDKISGAIDHDDFQTIRSQAHAVKGGAGNLTAYPLAGAAEALETAGAQKDNAQCKHAFQCMCKEAHRLKSHIHQTKGAKQGHVVAGACS